jgi:hypothetical protein
MHAGFLVLGFLAIGLGASTAEGATCANILTQFHIARSGAEFPLSGNLSALFQAIEYHGDLKSVEGATGFKTATVSKVTTAEALVRGSHVQVQYSRRQDGTFLWQGGNLNSHTDAEDPIFGAVAVTYRSSMKGGGKSGNARPLGLNQLQGIEYELESHVRNLTAPLKLYALQQFIERAESSSGLVETVQATERGDMGLYELGKPNIFSAKFEARPERGVGSMVGNLGGVPRLRTYEIDPVKKLMIITGEDVHESRLNLRVQFSCCGMANSLIPNKIIGSIESTHASVAVEIDFMGNRTALEMLAVNKTLSDLEHAEQQNLKILEMARQRKQQQASEGKYSSSGPQRAEWARDSDPDKVFGNMFEELVFFANYKRPDARGFLTYQLSGNPAPQVFQIGLRKYHVEYLRDGAIKLVGEDGVRYSGIYESFSIEDSEVGPLNMIRVHLSGVPAGPDPSVN